MQQENYEYTILNALCFSGRFNDTLATFASLMFRFIVEATNAADERGKATPRNELNLRAFFVIIVAEKDKN